MSTTQTETKQKFMAVVHLSGLTTEVIAQTMPLEDAIVRDLMNEGIVESLHVRGDLSGAFIVGNAASEDDYRASLSRLPLFPHMTIEFIPLFSMPEF